MLFCSFIPFYVGRYRGAKKARDSRTDDPLLGRDKNSEDPVDTDVLHEADYLGASPSMNRL
jgi:hypothetical protein